MTTKREEAHSLDGNIVRDAEQFRWAMIVLFRWAKKHEEAAIPMPVFHRHLGPHGRWKIAIPLPDGVRVEEFEFPDLAVIAVAAVIAATEPELVTSPMPLAAGSRRRRG